MAWVPALSQTTLPTLPVANARMIDSTGGTTGPVLVDTIGGFQPALPPTNLAEPTRTTGYPTA